MGDYLTGDVHDDDKDKILAMYNANMAKVNPAEVLTENSFPKATKTEVTNYIKGLQRMSQAAAFLPLLEPWQYKKKVMKIKQNEQKSRGKEKISITFAIIIHPNLSNISHIFLNI